MADEPWHAWLDRITAVIEAMPVVAGRRVTEWNAVRLLKSPPENTWFEVVLDDGRFFDCDVPTGITAEDRALLDEVVDALITDQGKHFVWRPPDIPPREPSVRPPRPFRDFVE